ncbi:MAG: Pvc16 family protein [Cyanobacteriota bacterium]|nr:Pvc16 family protein [Cyanobacteriota bacterium]
MIGTTLSYLRQRVDQSITSSTNKKTTLKNQQRVFLIGGEQAEPITFPQDAVSMLLLNLEEDREQRSLDAYRQTQPTKGHDQSIKKPPDIRLILHILFVAKFTDCALGWNVLSDVIGCFQANPALSSTNDPLFPAPLGMLTAEMISPSYSDINKIWSALRVSQRPAVLYRFKIITLKAKEEQPVQTVKTVKIEYQNH